MPGIYTTTLRRVAPGIYTNFDAAIRVSRFGDRWTAYFVAKLDQPEEAREIARGNSLQQCREKLERYLKDEATKQLGPRSRYGFHGDARPVAVR